MVEIYVASVTAFNSENKINETEQKKLMERNIEEGATGFFIGGSSGECFLLSLEERVKTFEIAYEFENKVDLIAHVGAVNTEDAITLAKEAKRIGYKKISATPPIYFGYGSKEVKKYFEDIYKAVNIPIIYYNIPMNTNYELNLNDDNIVSLFSSKVIVGIKHTDNDIYFIDQLKRLNGKLKIYGGLEQNMLSFMAKDCNSFIGSTFNFMLPHYIEIANLYELGKLEEAINLQYKANNIMDKIWGIGLFPSIKYILEKQGNNVGSIRKPFIALNNEEKKDIDEVLKQNLFI